MVLYDDLEQARHVFAGSTVPDCDEYVRDQDVCDEYIDSRYGHEDIPLPPPLKVLRTCWPNRRIETHDHLQHRERAEKDVSEWRKGTMGLGMGEDNKAGRLTRGKYLLCHTFIKVSAMLHTKDAGSDC